MCRIEHSRLYIWSSIIEHASCSFRDVPSIQLDSSRKYLRLKENQLHHLTCSKESPIEHISVPCSFTDWGMYVQSRTLQLNIIIMFNVFNVTQLVILLNR
jgi:hypothetical protein